MMDYKTINGPTPSCRRFTISSSIRFFIRDGWPPSSCLEIKPGDRILEVGVGTGLNLPLYPRDCDVTGMDISEGDAPEGRGAGPDPRHDRRQADGDGWLPKLEFPDNSFDRVIATYVISAVPDPVKTLLEMRRVCKPSGHLVILNHFKSENPIIGMFEKILAPVCTKIGFDTELKLMPLWSAWRWRRSKCTGSI